MEHWGSSDLCISCSSHVCWCCFLLLETFWEQLERSIPLAEYSRAPGGTMQSHVNGTCWRSAEPEHPWVHSCLPHRVHFPWCVCMWMCAGMGWWSRNHNAKHAMPPRVTWSLSAETRVIETVLSLRVLFSTKYQAPNISPRGWGKKSLSIPTMTDQNYLLQDPGWKFHT